MSAEPSHKIGGLKHLAAAQRYSLSGLGRLWQETAFRHEVAALAASLMFFAAIGAQALSYVALVMLFLLVVAVEAINTAIEEIIDRISPEQSLTGRHAKDLGSLAVYCGLVAWALLLITTLATRLGLLPGL
ncbi:diacylglycerol kinase (ATP) [Neorhizobium galegae]|nr:diacylglycerol kinase (ATP) [Neorhizobium galegae]